MILYIFITTLIFGIVLLLNKKQYKKDKFIHKHILTFVTIISFIGCFVYLSSIKYIQYITVDDIPEELIWQECYLRQTKAFANGSIALLEDASKLEKLKNPYNVKERDETKTYYLYDTTYYKGHYYSYFSIIPVVFIFLPFYKLFHLYLNITFVNLIILFTAIYVMSKLYKKIIDNYIKNISLSLYIIGFLTIIFGSNILLSIRGLKYDLPITCGLLFIFLTLYFIISMLFEKKIGYRLFFSGVFTAFIVISKPSYIIYYPLVFYLLYRVYKMKKMNIKHIIIYSLPLVIIGIYQMWYNYIRFDSIFEFGTKYQLTGFNIYEHQFFTFSKTIRGLKQYMLNLPTFNFNRFLYIFMTTCQDSLKGKQFLWGYYSLGIISFPIIVASFILLFKETDNLILRQIKKYLLIVFFIFLLLVIVNSTFAGVSEPYSIEYKCLLMFVSIIFLLSYITTNKNKLQIIFFILCIINILIVFPISFSGENLIFLDMLESIIYR